MLWFENLHYQKIVEVALNHAHKYAPCNNVHSPLQCQKIHFDNYQNEMPGYTCTTPITPPTPPTTTTTTTTATTTPTASAQTKYKIKPNIVVYKHKTCLDLNHLFPTNATSSSSLLESRRWNSVHSPTGLWCANLQSANIQYMRKYTSTSVFCALSIPPPHLKFVQAISSSALKSNLSISVTGAEAKVSRRRANEYIRNVCAGNTQLGMCFLVRVRVCVCVCVCVRVCNVLMCDWLRVFVFIVFMTTHSAQISEGLIFVCDDLQCLTNDTVYTAIWHSTTQQQKTGSIWYNITKATNLLRDTAHSIAVNPPRSYPWL